LPGGLVEDGLDVKVLVHTDRGNFGPINEGPVRTFWRYGLIPHGTPVTYGHSERPVPIESCVELNAFSKRLAEDAAQFNSASLLSQRHPSSIAQAQYLDELGWPFPVTPLNYYQADFLRKRLEEAFPDKRRVFCDPDNPWSPGSASPLNLTEEEREQRKYLEFLGVPVPETADLRLLCELVAEHDAPEKRRAYAEAPYRWKQQPATNRQLKVLRFFGMNPQARVNRGTANSLILRLFSDQEKRERWLKYKLLTGDFGDHSPELCPFDASELANVQLPIDRSVSHSEASRAIEDLVRSRRKQMWDYLNSPHVYWVPWLKMADMDAITKSAGIQELFEKGDAATFKKEFIEHLQSYSAEIADREKRHRIRRNVIVRLAQMVRQLLRR
jgi:hypothetical protein